jgi:hypothetical protein
VEGDLQAQYPDMLYSQLLAKAHEVLEERFKALSGQEIDISTANGAQMQIELS